MFNRFFRRVLRASDESDSIRLQREPAEVTDPLFEAHDALMKALDAAWSMQNPRLYDEVYQLLRKLAVLIDDSGRGPRA